MARKSSMDQHKADVERNTVFADPKTGHVFTRGPLVGKGGFGFVYETTMPGYTRRLVLKAIPKARVTKYSQRQRIENEIKLHKSLGHEHVVKLYHSFEESHVICMIIERCERSLLDLLQEQNRKVCEKDVSVVARQALYGLQYLHSENVIHRDLKLGNILLKNQLLVKICDFGLAKYYNRTDKPTICGTPNYLAPEVLQHHGHRPVSDVWSLGCVLVVLLTGRAPFEGESTDETYELIMHSQLAIVGKVSSETESFLTALLTKYHKDRAEVATALKHDFILKWAHLKPQTVDEETYETSWPIKDRAFFPPARAPLTTISESRRNVVAAGSGLLHRVFKQENTVQGHTTHPKSQTGDTEEVQRASRMDCLRIDAARTANGEVSILEVMNDGDDAGTDDENGFQLWIQCWIDYTNKDCGFAYRLSNDTVGVKLKTDKMSYVLKRTLDRKGEDFKYEYYSESRNKLVNFKTLDDVEKRIDERFRKHVQEMQNLVDYYDNYMQSNLINAGNMPNVSQNDVCKVRLLDWYKTKYCVAMVLTNYTLQVNFFSTHFKIVVQGQFDQPHGFQMPIPQTPSKPSTRRDMSVIAMSAHDIKQEFKIMFVNSKRRCFQLNVGVVLYLIQNPKNIHPNCTKMLEITPDELLTTVRQTHTVMHMLKPFSRECYSESLICNAFKQAGLISKAAGYNENGVCTSAVNDDAASISGRQPVCRHEPEYQTVERL